MYSSVKFLSPIVIGGLPLPGCEPELAAPQLEAEPPPAAVEDEELELPHAARAAIANKLPTITSARLSMDDAFPSDIWSVAAATRPLPKAATLSEGKCIGALGFG